MHQWKNKVKTKNTANKRKENLSVDGKLMVFSELGIMQYHGNKITYLMLLDYVVGPCTTTHITCPNLLNSGTIGLGSQSHDDS